MRRLPRTVQRPSRPGTPAPIASAARAAGRFRTDVSYLPDLQACLDDLLRSRERLAVPAHLPGGLRMAAASSRATALKSNAYKILLEN